MLDAAAAGAASAGADSAAGASEPLEAVSKTKIREPVFTLSPVAILISLTVPAIGAGTSIDALSPSTLNKDCSSSTVSPTATMISVTSTSSSPISGTVTSCVAEAAGAAAGAGASSLASAGAAACSSPSKIMISEPVVTVSPSATLISLTVPACAAGTSIDALSPSTVNNDWSTSTLSPTLTRISVTSTSSPPISGTLISILIGTSYAYSGLTLFVSMSNFLIASTTTDFSTSPRLASSDSVATTT